MVEKIMVLGWDGATWDYLDPLLAEGKLPHLASLLVRGSALPVNSTIPPFTSIAWPALVTGCTPARTGVFDGARARPGSYRAVPTSVTGFRGVPIWNWVNRWQKRAGVLNVPMTYPAAALDGYLVSGFDSPKNSPLVAYPAGILQAWSEQFQAYRVLSGEIALMDSQNPHHARGDLADFTRRWVELTEHQGEMIAWLWENQPVDLLFAVFSGTDSINHRTRDFGYIRQVYQAADRALGRILEAIGDQTLLCLVSDHGSTPARRYLALYRALYDAGWLRFRPRLASRFWRRLPARLGSLGRNVWGRMPAVLQQLCSWPLLQADSRLQVAYDNMDWDQTRVFARSGMGALYVNAAGRYPRGTVPADHYADLLGEIRDYFLGLRDQAGSAIFGRVWLREELYPDARPDDDPPDLFLEPAQWSDHMITGYPTDPLVRPIPDSAEYGAHALRGIAVFCGPNIRPGKRSRGADLTDIVPTLLAAWDLPIPAESDGQVLEDIFRRPPATQRISSQQTAARGGEASLQETEEVLARMRALGYLD